MKQPSTACAVVVTYNRLALLKECIAALQTQSRPLDHILVINNGSTDGTAEWLAEQSGVQCLTQGNLGGAGGFHTGLKEAYALGFDWIWCMDDDTIPEAGALDGLLEASSLKILDKEPGFICSLVVDPDGQITCNPRTLALTGPNNQSQTLALLSHSCMAVRASTFVSVMFSKRTVETYGFPCPEYVIFGDDTEYTTRVTKGRFGICTGKSRVLHKTSRKGWNIESETDSQRITGYYYKYRNEFWTAKKHRGWSGLAKVFVLTLKDVFVSALAPTYRAIRLKTILRGGASGLFTRPPVTAGDMA
jgi:GT2 family glycosyltransferase